MPEPAGNERSTRRRMPQLDLPKFSGRYAAWESFKDLFQSMVKPHDVTNAERLKYLKTCLTREAAALIRNFPVTSDNYTRA